MIFVPRNRLRCGMKLAHNPVLPTSDAYLLRAGVVLTPDLLQRLQRFDNLDGVFIEDGFGDEETVIRPILSRRVRDEAIDNLQGMFHAALQDSQTMGLTQMRSIKSTVSEIISSIQGAKQVMVNINDLKAYDDYTYHHCLSVAVLAVAAGIELGISERELQSLGLAAILHDIGKMMVPIQIINKPARLTPQEFNIIKKHPMYGIQYLEKYHLGNKLVSNGIAMHHERIDGRGYPFGIRDMQIPLFARIISVTDVYDALTSKRPYRAPLQPFEATEYMMANCGKAFDQDIMQAFLAKLELYPKGSYVRLNDNCYYLVVDTENNFRPVVRALVPPFDTIDLCSPEYLSLVVTRAVDQLPSEELESIYAQLQNNGTV